jgi:hypothetical protein
MPGMTCWNCGIDTKIEGIVMRSDQCESCVADLRSCRGCRHFDPTRRFQCRENIVAPVQPKDKANFCDFFQGRLRGKAAGRSGDAAEERKTSFDDLFKD